MNQHCSVRSVRTTGVTLADVSGGVLRVLRSSRGVRGTLRLSEGALTVRGAADAGDDVVELPLAWVDDAHGRQPRGLLRPGLLIVGAQDPATGQQLSVVVTTARGVDAIAAAREVADAAAAAGRLRSERSGRLRQVHPSSQAAQSGRSAQSTS
ncbi:hypothetical protein [Actinotalea fermentans]|uniref:Uncharacterized protein n=1 Tax=Actinotalea fermentans TaxID=43671 RepID=A0A511YZ58_9CELL|nr:hypothetical protein [Actinotalea fermentans]KGM15147.1 hypothetical protein N867_11665 [Actinotalea fermentans ATCC 43279 = JCM 9966 = DSM 3133]GEN80497.1 hypothetical protein AFE02nite_22310 [Actinotalea fermentans]